MPIILTSIFDRQKITILNHFRPYLLQFPGHLSLILWEQWSISLTFFASLTHRRPKLRAEPIVTYDHLLTLRNITMSFFFFPCKIPIPYDASYVYDAWSVFVKSYSKIHRSYDAWNCVSEIDHRSHISGSAPASDFQGLTLHSPTF